MNRWADTAIELPEAAAHGSAIELFTGRKLQTDGNVLRLSEAMATLPFALYASR